MPHLDSPVRISTPRLIAAVLALLLLSLPASAGIIATSGTVTGITPSAGADFTEGGAFETGAGTNTVWAFQEAEAIPVVSFPVDLQPVDLVSNWSPGNASTPTTLTQDVDVHYPHLDTQDGSNVVLTGFVEFDAAVLGVLVETATLDATDATASPGFSFDPARSLGGTDSIRLEAANRRLVFDFTNGVGVDSLRVVTGDVAVSSTFTQIVIAGGESFVEGGAFEGSGGINTAFWFAERSGIDVVDLEVDLDTSSLQAGWAVPQSTAPTAVSGRVDSYYVFFDSLDDSQLTSISGTITLPGPVVGVIFTDASLQTSDAIVGAPGVTFAGTRALGTVGDGVQLDVSGQQLRVDFTNAAETDDIRILVGSPAPVPSLAPMTCFALIGALVGLGAVVVRRRRHAA